MTVCHIEEQAHFLGKWACAFLINNNPPSIFDILSVSISLLVFVWLFSMLFTSRILRVVCRSLALAFTFCGLPVPLPFFYPLFVPVIIPDWPSLFTRNAYEGPEYFAPRTFLLIFAMSSIVLGTLECRRNRGARLKENYR